MYLANFPSYELKAVIPHNTPLPPPPPVRKPSPFITSFATPTPSPLPLLSPTTFLDLLLASDINCAYQESAWSFPVHTDLT